jgi:DNA-binding transcriptional regulator YhcF (GntR family)
MPSNKEEEFREQLKELVSEYEKKGVSIEMIIDYVNSLIKH